MRCHRRVSEPRQRRSVALQGGASARNLRRRLGRHIPFHVDVMSLRIRLSGGRQPIKKCFEPRLIFCFDGRGERLDLLPRCAFIVKFGELLVFVSIDGQNICMQGDRSLQNVPAIFCLFEFSYSLELGRQRSYFAVYYLLSLHRCRRAGLAVRQLRRRTFQFSLQAPAGKALHQITIEDGKVEVGFRCGGVAGWNQPAARYLGDEMNSLTEGRARLIASTDDAIDVLLQRNAAVTVDPKQSLSERAI